MEVIAMKNSTQNRAVKLTASTLIVLVLLCSWASAATAERICKNALAKCFVDAVITMIFSGPQTAAFFAAGCLDGYFWCLEYYVDFEKK